jgi:hypothetical protein
MRKVYVDVYAEFSSDGRILPLSFTWEDGRDYKIDRIMDIRPMAATKVGGFGMRYTIEVLGKESHMWLEHDGKRWFMEGKN